MQPPIVATFEFEAPPVAVFDAWTLAEHVKAWWREPDEFVTEEWTAFLRPGGAWRVVFRAADGSKSSMAGAYQAIARPRTLHFTCKADWDDEPPTEVLFEFAAGGAGTQLTVTHSGFANAQAREDNADAWNAPMAMVRAYLDGQ